MLLLGSPRMVPAMKALAVKYVVNVFCGTTKA